MPVFQANSFELGGQAEPPPLPSGSVTLDNLLPRRCPASARGAPLLFTLPEIVECASAACLPISVFRFTELAAGETLQEHVKSLGSSIMEAGPLLPESVVYVSPPLLSMLGRDMASAAQFISKMWRTTCFAQEWKGLVKGLRLGNMAPMLQHIVNYGSPSMMFVALLFPAIIIQEGAQGCGTGGQPARRWWGLVRQGVPLKDVADPLGAVWGLRHLLTVKLAPVCVTIVEPTSGQPLWQNGLSMATFGCCAKHNLLAPSNTEASCANQEKGSDRSHVDFLGMLFFGRQILDGTAQAQQLIAWCTLRHVVRGA